MSPNRHAKAKLQIQASGRRPKPRTESHYEKCPPTGRPMPNFKSKHQARGPDPDRTLVMKNVAQQADQISITIQAVFS